MTKSELIDRLAERTSLSKKAVGEVLNAFTAVVTEAVANDERVSITGFGHFSRKTRAARKGRNPSTNAIIDIPERLVPSFKPGKAFRNAVAEKQKKTKKRSSRKKK
ncbi:MAG: HU family DNA-binding protein [Deltaproteobacteria bacterium]|nr:MAG: HU family DNA-binding protein [Deltaproteobacteria bacterium]